MDELASDFVDKLAKMIESRHSDGIRRRMSGVFRSSGYVRGTYQIRTHLAELLSARQLESFPDVLTAKPHDMVLFRPIDPTRPRHFENVLALRPASAWLLVADAASRSTPAQMRRSWGRASQQLEWTSPKQVQLGDLLFFYFIDPDKEIQYAARASADPFYDPTMEVNALKEVGPHQWWVTYAAQIAINPIPFRRLQSLMGGYLNLRGRPRHYLPPDVVKSLIADASLGGYEAETRVLQVPSGNPDLPDPEAATFAQWRNIAPGAMRLESEVERYIVRPMLRFAGLGSGEVLPQYLCGRGRADFAVGTDGKVTAVIEVKLGARQPLATSPDSAQVRSYMKTAGVPGVLVDSTKIALFDLYQDTPRMVMHRKDMTGADLRLVRDHVRKAHSR